MQEGDKDVPYVYNRATGEWEKAQTGTIDAGFLNQNIACCTAPKTECLLGYNYLRNGISLPLGFEVAGVYNLTARTGLKASISGNFGKEDDRKYDREFILAGIQYSSRDCDQEAPSLFTNLMIGYSRDAVKYMNTKSSGGGFAAAIGGGINFKLNNKTSVQIKSDVKSVFANGKMNLYWAMGTGISWQSGGCKSPQAKYDKAFQTTIK
jgi:hypothetical protein